MNEFLAELKRRQVYRAGAAYAVVAWGLTQVVDILSQVFALPLWIGQTILIVLAIGFPVTLLVAWTIEGKAHQALMSGMRAKHSGVDWLLAGALVCVIALIGYQQMAPVTPGPSAPAVTRGNSIAVLPFANLSPDAENAFFADGIHDNLLTQLSKISALRVISRTSVMGYRERTQNLRQIGEELGVANIVEGGVQRAGGFLRINVQLIDAQTDENIWAESYDRELTTENIFAIQSEITSAISAALRANLLPQEIAQLHEVPTQNTRAYDFYLSGNQYYDRTDFDVDLPLAADMYERAVAEDPNFALAWAALSRTHVLIHWFSIDRSEDRLTRAREAAERALQLSPDLPEAHLAMGDYHYRSTRDYVRALSEYALAEQGMPGNVQILEAKAYIQRRIGQWDESIASMDAAIQLDPRNIGRLLQQGHTFRSLKRYDDAERLYARALEISPDAVDPFMNKLLIPLFRDGDVTEIKEVLAHPPFPLGDWDYDTGWTIGLYERDYDAALAALARHVASDADTPLDLARLDLMAALAHHLAGRADEARTHYGSALAKLEAYLPTDPSDPRTHIAIGEALAGLGRNDDAVRAGQHALLLRPVTVDAIDGQVLRLDALVSVFLPAGAYDLALRELDAYLGTAGGGWTLAGILPDPRFDPVRDMPEFTAIEEKYAAP